jgi:SAM-dependent methyltransferase
MEANRATYRTSTEVHPVVSGGWVPEMDPVLVQQDRFDSDAYYTRLGSMLAFEIKSFVGRAFGFLPTLAATKDFLNLGSGAAPQRDFTNVDFYNLRTKASLWRKGYSFVQHDLRFPLPFPADTFLGVYSEHTVEHLYPVHAQRLFKEVHRVLKPGGVFRCIVPDLAKYVACYNKESTGPEFAHFTNGCEAMWSLTQNWGHISVWDAEMLQLKLRQAGFARTEPCEFRQGSLPPLLVDLEARRWQSVCVEAHKE